MSISHLVKNYSQKGLSTLRRLIVSFVNGGLVVFAGLLLSLSPNHLSANSDSLFSFADLFSYPDAPTLDLPDLYGDQLSLTSYKGKIVIVSFLDKKSQEEATTWVESLPASYLGDSRIVFVNVVFPGGISFLVPRPKVVSRLRQDIEDLRESFRKSLSPKEQLEMESTEIRWAADWKRDWASRWGSIRHMVNVFIIDRNGKLRDTIRGMNDGVQNRLNMVVSRLLDMGE